MRASRKHRAPLMGAAVVVWVFANNGLLPAVCDFEPDSPTCPCFDPTGAWDPAGTVIQDVALQTLGTIESCKCPGTSGCTWVLDNSGKPYYQMVLGCTNDVCAEFASAMLSQLGQVFDEREEWCSETVSFWHRETGMPYRYGYASPWHGNWKIQGVDAMMLWYLTEEYGGRGRWIWGDRVTYDPDRFELGVTVPVPGAYVAIRAYDDQWDAWYVGDQARTHSLMVDEVWVHKRPDGHVFRVAVTLIEGNSSEMVTNQRYWSDVLSLTPQGASFIGSNRKIYGFGVDLDEEGELVYDPSRLHLIEHLYAYAPPLTSDEQPDDPDGPALMQVLSALRPYADEMRTSNGPLAWSSSNDMKVSRLPGPEDAWDFPAGIAGPLDLTIDLRGVHPLGIRGLTFHWAPGFAPLTMTVKYSSDGQQFIDATVPSLVNTPLPAQGAPIMVPAAFTTAPEGVPVRFITIGFPAGAFPQAASLREISFRYAQARWPDAPFDEIVPVVDIKPGSCPNPLNVTSKGVLPVAVLGRPGLRVRDIDPASVRLEGVPALRWSYGDVATTRDPRVCTGTAGRDGIADLVLHFDTPAVVDALGRVADGSVRTLGLTARLRGTGAAQIEGADRVVVKVPKKRE